MAGLGQVLVLLDGSAGCESALQVGLSLSRSYNSRLEALHISFPHQASIAVLDDASGFVINESLVEKLDANSGENAKRIQDKFSSICLREKVKIVEAADSFVAGEARAVLRQITGHEGPVLATEGRIFDLIILAKPEKSQGGIDSAVLEAALFETGRPVMIVQGEKTDLIGENIAIAWDGSREVAHSVAMSMPVIANAKSVNIFSVDSEVNHSNSESLKDYLSCHGIDSNTVNLESNSKPVADTLLEAIHLSQSDLLIMGAFGQSPFNEFIFGGVTRTMLKLANIPIILAH